MSKQFRFFALALTSLSATSCSIIFVRPDPTVLRSGKTVCGTHAAPAADLVATMMWAGIGVFADNICLSEGGPAANPDRCGPSVSHYIPAMIAAASSIYGFWAVSRCEHKLAELSRDAAQPLPARLGP